ncbi:hypothetical protein ACA910_008465 [Epithemia clementina (nom. ined.)]
MKMMRMNHEAGGNQFSKLFLSMAIGTTAGGGRRKYEVTAHVDEVTTHVDDSSLSQSSTHTVTETPKVALPPNKTTTHRICSSVHFQEEHNVYYDALSYPMPKKNIKTITDQQKQQPNQWADCWYTSNECDQMKEAYLNDCHKLQRLVVDSLAGKETEDNHIEAILMAYEACDQGYISKSVWLTIGSACERFRDRAGMEHVIVDAGIAGIARDRKHRRRQRLLEQVMHLCVPERFPSLSKQQLAELIRERCSDITEPARLFALAVGQANDL